MNEIRNWKNGDFTLSLYETGKRDEYNKHVLGYRFSHKGEVIFQGEDYHCSPCHAPDSDASVYELLSFFALRPGDTDPDYFKNYTRKQRQFRDKYADELNLLVIDAEEVIYERS